MTKFIPDIPLQDKLVLESSLLRSKYVKIHFDCIDHHQWLQDYMNTLFTGLLFLTGILWGCTNPFIRQGTRGLRKVKSNTKLGQAYAEITFLLGNWRYVFPWLVNQAGSLVYLAVVQRVPLSVAVPAANSLAFAFTTLTGSAVGAEERLNYGSIFGIVLIGFGTALCCWDKTN